jgi:hypothetical protein
VRALAWTLSIALTAASCSRSVALPEVVGVIDDVPFVGCAAVVAGPACELDGDGTLDVWLDPVRRMG